MTRSEARDFALKIIFSYPFHDDMPLQDYLNQCYDNLTDLKITENNKQYIESVTQKCFENVSQIDDVIGNSLKNWKLERISKVNRAILRLAVTEIKYFDDIPEKVSINEAIELAKPYGEDESPSFINGVLANIIKD